MVNVTHISNTAFSLAYRTLEIGGGLTDVEKASAPAKIREYIDALVSSGERDPEKIAHTSVCLVREYEQIARSAARVHPRPSTAP